MIDFIVRDCGRGEYLPIIKETDTGRELYRGERVKDPVQALNRAQMIWAGNGTGNIADFKQEKGL